ncbi:Sid2p-Mob1p kinase complex regulatory subunit Mob1 [Saitoella complicata NRRL Y-17804]|uniref:Sid2p-Mob1p kinase complex regulatory subunit Mob1 n=1 Tax=Saitoella complicata (strain BCRC 22490 / CBS 7301 / JCM 7358 / NBRC 10748 / NRRL Y-17804) TaxID=698492 RepID=UPI000867BEA8|nr:Sid2p-Mob1p kinase complex regulatory subunit Mob1 [Saitoella complicata NRRL Y-17804]ODQ50673.1 Sid2p-Mob1p kinase complex regulatory subunit Mob1 [Saitoella complicata NRRL Y-17804]
MFSLSRKPVNSKANEPVSKSFQLRRLAEATLGSGNLKKAVQLPEGEDLNEWLAVNTVDFFQQINMLYGTITEFCTPTSCPMMSAGPTHEYLWHDPPNYPSPTSLPASTYIDLLFTRTQSLLDNPLIFPQKPGIPFPRNFRDEVSAVLRRLFRVYAHIYWEHYAVVRELGLEAHLNTGLKHFVCFCREFGVVGEKEFEPLRELVDEMMKDN